MPTTTKLHFVVSNYLSIIDQHHTNPPNSKRNIVASYWANGSFQSEVIHRSLKAVNKIINIPSVAHTLPQIQTG